MNPQAMLNYLLGATEGLVMYAIYSDYANKLQNISTGKGFDIDEDGYVPKAYKTIVDFTGVRPDTVKSSIERLIKKGLLQKKPGNADTYNIPLYRPEFKSSVFIEIAKEKLKTSTANKLNQQSDKEVLPQIISTLEKDQYVMIALGLIKFPEETKSSKESNPPEEKDELILKYVSVLQQKWEVDNNETTGDT